MGGTQDRTWRIGPDPETGLVDPEEVVGEFAQLGWLVLRLGGGVAVAPERFQHPESGEWVTRAINIRWTSFVPPVQQPRQEEQLPGIDEDALATLEGQEPFEEPVEPDGGQPEAAEEPAVALE